MLKLIPLILSLILSLCSCGNQPPKTVTVEDNPFTAQISIDCDGGVYEYSYSYKGLGASQFRSINNSLPIDFSWENGIWTASNGGANYIVPEDIVAPIPIVVSQAVDSTVGEELTADYNGEFKHYGTCSAGEYCLTVTEESKIKNIIIESLNLKAEFS